MGRKRLAGKGALWALKNIYFLGNFVVDFEDRHGRAVNIG
jgi:hypothetical protein